MRPRIFFTLLTFVGLGFSGCLPESKNPLSSPAASRVDPRLSGVYQQRPASAQEDPAYWHFHYRGATPGRNQQRRVTTTIEILGVSHQSEAGLDGAHYRAFATRLGGHDYLSFFEEKPGSAKRENFNFARYEVNWRGDLLIWLLDNEAVAAAITAGRVRGQVRSGKFGKDVLLTDTTERLAAFVAATDPATLFGKTPVSFRRLTSAAAQR